ncbi:hypothetical protein H1C71_027371 [Ictidomys tridecemlineatus]|nr:hypothetical protein H1C71_027371 [Ictidomys tridecemlineatus]
MLKGLEHSLGVLEVGVDSCIHRCLLDATLKLLVGVSRGSGEAQPQAGLAHCPGLPAPCPLPCGALGHWRNQQNPGTCFSAGPRASGALATFSLVYSIRSGSWDPCRAPRGSVSQEPVEVEGLAEPRANLAAPGKVVQARRPSRGSNSCQHLSRPHFLTFCTNPDFQTSKVPP